MYNYTSTRDSPIYILMVKWTSACGLAEEKFVCVHMQHFWGLKDISEIYHHLLP